VKLLSHTELELCYAYFSLNIFPYYTYHIELIDNCDWMDILHYVYDLHNLLLYNFATFHTFLCWSIVWPWSTIQLMQRKGLNKGLAVIYSTH